MIHFILRRLLYTIPVLFGVTLIVFLLFHYVGGNPVYHMLPKNANPEEILALQKQLGLDKSLLLQYFDYMGNLLQLDFGRSWETKQRISQMMLEGLGPSIALALPAFLLGTLVSLCFAALAAYVRGSWLDRFLVAGSVLGMSVSILAFIIAGQYYLAYRHGLFPISGFEWGLKGIPYLALPIWIWVLSALGEDVRYYRAVLLEEMRRDYVNTARAKGLSKTAIMLKHIFPNAMIPIVTRLVMSLPSLVAGSLLLETFFGIPGLGNLSINALNASDLPVLKAITFFGTLIYMAANLLGDVLYSAVDPRVRLE